MDSKFGKLNIVHAVFCCLALGCGITYSVLVSNLLTFIYERLGLGSNSAVTGVTTILWIIGFAYIVPAVLGLIAAGLRKRVLYIVHMVLSFIAIGILGYLFLRGIASAGIRSGGIGFCSTTNQGNCVCDTSALESLLEYFNCDEVNRIVRTGISTDAMFFGGGVVTFIAAVLSGFLTRNVQQPQQATGMVNMATMYPNGTQYQYPGQGQGTQYQYPGQGTQYQYPGQGQSSQYQYPGQGQGQDSQYPTKISSI